MSGLLEDGIGLMVVGMGFVFLFLIILIFVTGYMSRLLNHFFPEEQVVTPKKSAAHSANASPVDGQMAAIITAAVHQHRKNNNTN